MINGESYRESSDVNREYLPLTIDDSRLTKKLNRNSGSTSVRRNSQ